MFNLNDGIIKRTDVKIVSFKMRKNINTDNIEETAILENQMEIHDYKHLGRLLTDAVTMKVPIGIMATSQTINDEYVIAIKWLNKPDNDDTSFFLVRPNGSQTDNPKSTVGFNLN